jgi:mercuric ion transport protein
MPNPVDTTRRSLIASVAAALTASVCCVGPLALLALGVSGAWIANLTALEPYRPIFIGATLVFLGLAFRKLYLLPRTCEPGKACAVPTHLRKQRTAFWMVSVLLVGLLAFPWYAPLIID